MKCLRKNCDGDLRFDSYAGMGTFHSNYYKCNKCGDIYLIYDRNSFPPRRVAEGMKCLLRKLKYGSFDMCQEWGCPRLGWDKFSWSDKNYGRNYKNCGYRLKWTSKRKTPKKEPPRELTYLERNALRVAELKAELDGEKK